MPKAGCTNDIDVIVLVGNTNVSLGARSGWYCLLPASFLARRDASLTTLLKVGRYEVLLCNLALVFFARERPKGAELPEDNSSSTGVSTSTRMAGFFPLLRVIEYAG